MVDITDKFGKASIDNDYAIATTVKTTRTVGVTVLEAFDLSKFSDDTPVFFITYKKSIDPVTDEVSVIDLVSWKALVNPGLNTLTNMEVAPGYVDIGNDEGDFIECIPTSYGQNSLIDGLLTSLNPDGTIKDEILTSFPSEFANFVGDGCVWTQLSGLNGQATSGHVWYGGKKYAISSIASKAFTASRDTYVDINPVTDTYTYLDVANNAAEPAVTADSVRVAKAMSDGSAITTVAAMNRMPVTSNNINFKNMPFGLHTIDTSAGSAVSTSSVQTFKTINLTDLVVGRTYMVTTQGPTLGASAAGASGFMMNTNNTTGTIASQTINQSTASFQNVVHNITGFFTANATTQAITLRVAANGNTVSTATTSQRTIVVALLSPAEFA